MINTASLVATVATLTAAVQAEIASRPNEKAAQADIDSVNAQLNTLVATLQAAQAAS